MLPLIGGIISAGAGLLGGMMNNNAQQRVNSQNIAATEKANAQNLAAQKEFAQHGIRWRVDDAERSGVHPLYALGAQTPSFSPSFQAGHSESGRPGDGLAAAGQDIGRAVSATLTPEERLYNQSLQGLQLERAGLENELLRTQIRRQLYETGPGFPAAAGAMSPGYAGAEPTVRVNVGGSTVQSDRGWSNAQEFEDRYGEAVSIPAGLGIAIADIVKSIQTSWASGAESRYRDRLQNPPRMDLGPRNAAGGGW